MPKVLTTKWLEEQGACPSSLERFRWIFGEECSLTTANVERWIRAEGMLFWNTARNDLAWLTLRLVGRRNKWYGFFGLPLAGEVLRHLGIRAQGRPDKAYLVFDAFRSLPMRRLRRAIPQIAERSPNI